MIHTFSTDSIYRTCFSATSSPISGDFTDGGGPARGGKDSGDT